MTVPVAAASGDRTLYLYYTHTKETGRFTFKRNGQYDQKVLKQLNVFLRDWRRNEPAKMDPALFDLVWTVYNEVGGSQPIHIVSAYRSPATNAALRKRSSGVAENSQHTKGHAMDFFIPGVDLSKLRATAMRHQVGGVGYYPTSGSPFVHLDTGNVRAWPRMTRAQLKKVFPDGRTLHLPADGKPLSEDGRRFAQAEWQKCHRVPCNGSSFVPETTMVANNDEAPNPALPSRNLMDMIFGDEDMGEAETQVASAELSGPAQREVTTIAVHAPTPAMRTDAVGGQAAVAAVQQDLSESLPFSTVGSAPIDASAADAPMPATRSQTILLATGPSSPLGDGNTAVSAIAALDESAPVPQPRVLMTAYAPEITPDPEAQRALQILIERETAASAALESEGVKQPALIGVGNMRTASLGGPGGFGGLFEATWSAVSQAGVPEPVAEALKEMTGDSDAQSVAGLQARHVDFVAPDFDHVADTMVLPVAMSSRAFSFMYEPDEGSLDPQTELGTLSSRITRHGDSSFGLHASSFRTGTPMLLASR